MPTEPSRPRKGCTNPSVCDHALKLRMKVSDAGVKEVGSQVCKYFRAELCGRCTAGFGVLCGRCTLCVRCTLGLGCMLCDGCTQDFGCMLCGRYTLGFGVHAMW